MASRSIDKGPLVIGVDARAANDRVRAGVGKYCNELLRAMGALTGDDTLRLYLDSSPGSHFPIVPGNVEVVVLDKRWGWSQRVLGRELRRSPPDVFFAPTTQIPLCIPCAVVSTIHDLAFFDLGEYFTWTTRQRSRLQARYAVRRAQHLLAISQATKDDLIRRFHVSPSTVTATPLGASKNFRPSRDAEDLERLRKTYRLPDRYILYLGRIQPRKNLSRLIDAYSVLRGQTPDLAHGLVIAGDRGWMDDPIFEHARKSPVAGSICFVGYVEEADLAPLISNADVLTIVALWEGFGIPAVEAMACGTAVVASNCSSLPEVVGDAGLTVDPYDVEAIAGAIRSILDNDDFRKTREREGLERAAEFTWERTARLTIEVLRNVGSAHRHR